MTTIFFTNTSSVRAFNEDAILAGPVYADLSMEDPMVAMSPGNLIAVADGMGGGPGGALAAKVVLEDLSLMLRNGANGQKAHDLILECLYEAVARLNRIVKDEPWLIGLGATVAGLWQQGEAATIFNCGDCRVYRLREQHLELLSRDHSTVFSLFLEGLISFDDIRSHPQRNLITSAIQQGNQHLDVFSRVVRLRQGDLFFICSDGVWESLEEASLEVCLSSLDLEECALTLAQGLLENNCGDNFSFVLQNIDLAET
jgi:protein phosphatase